MSFILDALRKADDQRGGPGSMDTPPMPARASAQAVPSRNVGLMMAMGVIAVAVTVLAVFMYGRSTVPTVVPAPAVAVTTPTPAAPVTAGATPVPVPPPARARAQVRPLDREAATATSPRAAPSAPSQPDQPPKASTAPTPGRVVYSDGPLDATSPPPPVATAPAAAAPPPPPQGLVMYNDLAMNNRSGMPPLRLDIHVYSDEPANRFVFVNMRKYREGDRMKDGIVVDRITPDGAIMSLRGQQFLLPRT